MGVFKVTVVYYVCSRSKDKAEESVIKLVGSGFHHSLSTEDVTCLPSVEDEQEYQDIDLNF